MPVAQYVGGVEHAILHLLYSRFFMKVLHDMGMVDAVEPFAALMNQGQVINQGKAMSKSLGNGVDLGKELSAYGVDAVRLTVVFAGPPEDDIDWADVSPAGSVKYLARVARLAEDVAALTGDDARRRRSTGRSRAAVDEVTRADRGAAAERRRRQAHGADERAAQGRRRGVAGRRVAARRRRGAGRHAGLLGAVHRRGGLVAPGPRRRARATRCTTRPGRPPTRRCWCRSR